jgi:hypothetical protein
METAADGQTGEIRTEPDEHPRQCNPKARTLFSGMALTSHFAERVRDVDVDVRFLVIALGRS